MAKVNRVDRKGGSMLVGQGAAWQAAAWRADIQGGWLPGRLPGGPGCFAVPCVCLLRLYSNQSVMLVAIGSYFLSLHLFRIEAQAWNRVLNLVCSCWYFVSVCTFQSSQPSTGLFQLPIFFFEAKPNTLQHFHLSGHVFTKGWNEPWGKRGFTKQRGRLNISLTIGFLTTLV